MRVGIDLGTTRTVVAVADRGNYPILGFEDPHGDVHEYIPSTLAMSDGRLLCGWEAEAAWRRGAPAARSIKRLFAHAETGADTPVTLTAPDGSTAVQPFAELLDAFAAHVLQQTRRSLGTSLDGDSPLQAMLGVPAAAGNAQRLATMSAVSRAGAAVLGLVNEPSASAFEFTHRHARTMSSRRTQVVVFDLGGGTFDASSVRITGTEHVIERTAGIARLGGDDFDAVLAQLARDQDPSALDAVEDAVLREAARRAKERLTPQSRRALLELGQRDVTVDVASFYAAATPLVAQAIEAMSPLVEEDAGSAVLAKGVAGIYLVGGASELPLVGRVLRERFGRRVHRSPYPSASTAIGLAIAADESSPLRLRDRIARGISVFREESAGEEITLDSLIAADAPLAEDGTITVRRTYRAAHNIGWLRYVEHARSAAGEERAGDVHAGEQRTSAQPAEAQPAGDLTLLAEVAVPYDASLRGLEDLSSVPVERREGGPMVTETLTVDADGVAHVRFDLEDGWSVSQTLAHGAHARP